MGRLLPVGQAFLCLGLAGATAGTAALLSVEEVSFGRDIRPLFSNHCFLRLVKQFQPEYPLLKNQNS